MLFCLAKKKDHLHSFLHSALSKIGFEVDLFSNIILILILALRYVQLLWAMEFAETHIGRPHSLAFNKCSDDLQV